jgi:hypothetical protein
MSSGLSEVRCTKWLYLSKHSVVLCHVGHSSHLSAVGSSTSSSAFCFILLLITPLLCLMCQLEHAKYFIKNRRIIYLHTEWSCDFRIQERLNLNNDSQYKVSSLSVSLEHTIGLCRDFNGRVKVTGTSAVFHVTEIMEARPLLCHGVCGSQHFKDNIAFRMLVDTHSMIQHHIL